MPSAQTRNQSLDVLRCIAVLLVLGFHFPRYFLLARAGWIGVDLFFVLSGFLISGLLFQEYKATGRISFRRFFIRRGLKIWPPFYTFIAATAAIFLYSRSPVPWRAFLVSSLFLQNYLHDSPIIAGGVFVHLWSLAVEEHFYVLLPLLFIVLLKCNPGPDPFRSLPAIFGSIAGGCLLLRFIALRQAALPWATHLRADSLFAGVLVSYLYHFRRNTFEKLARTRNLAIALVCVLPVTFRNWDSFTIRTFGLTCLWITFSILVAWSVERKPRSSLFSPLARIGFYSYSIYLWHIYFVILFEGLGSSTIAFWLASATAVAFGTLMYKLVEWPFLILRNRWLPSKVIWQCESQRD